MVEPLRHRQTKEAGTRMPDLTSPRHIPTLPKAVLHCTVCLRSDWRLLTLGVSSVENFVATGEECPLSAVLPRSSPPMPED
jgi:hypothetical protein